MEGRLIAPTSTYFSCCYLSEYFHSLEHAVKINIYLMANTEAHLH